MIKCIVKIENAKQKCENSALEKNGLFNIFDQKFIFK
jgi:hypothetical protein